MEIVSEGSLESISRPASTSKKSSSRLSVRPSESSLQYSLDILPSEDPSLNLPEIPQIEEDVIIVDVNEDELSIDGENNQSISLKVNEKDDKESTLGSHSEIEINDPAILKGMERIKKLDNILKEKVKNEKEVKKQRRELEQLWREQLEMLEKNRDVNLGKPVDLGPAHMLALGAPDNCEEITGEDSPPITPVFATEHIDDERKIKHEMKSNTKYQQFSGTHGCYESSSNDNMSRWENSSEVNKDESDINNKDNMKSERKSRKKDFIKRNILLAADANNTIAMTDEEKKRLEEILSDMGDLMEKTVDKDCIIPYGNGFVPTVEEAKQLEDIDLRLQSLIPSDDYAILCGQNDVNKEPLVLNETERNESSGFNHSEDELEDVPTFGELVLQEKKTMRMMKERLMAIEEQLQRFQNDDRNDDVLSASLLRQLLDGSSRATSRSLTSSSSFDTSSVTSSMSTVES